MSQEYLASFNGGELSPFITSRTDLPIYKNGCATLRNFYVKPTGAVERRQGSKYIINALTNSRLIPFSFNSDESYIVEISPTFIKILASDGSLIASQPSPFETDDIPDIKYIQSVDIIYMVCPNKPVHTLSRTSISPVTFEIEEMEFNYPPFIEENTNKDSYIEILSPQWLPNTSYTTGQKINRLGVQYAANADFTSTGAFVVGNWTAVAGNTAAYNVGDTVTLISSENEFNSKLENSYFRLSHQRANETILLEGENDGSAGPTGLGYTKVFDEVYVGDGKVNVTYNVWLSLGSAAIGQFLIEKKIGLNGSWTNETSIDGPASGTYTFTGTSDEYIRVSIRSSKTYSGNVVSGGSFSITQAFIKRVEFTSASDAQNKSEALDVSFSDWDINTTGTWTGSLELEKSIDGGGTWDVITTVADTASLAAENITVSSPSKEGANTLIRLSFNWASGTLVSTLTNTTFRSEGITRITNYIDNTTVEAIIISKPLSNATTNRWSFGAFSELRGYPSAIEFFNSRLVFSGTIQDPSKVYMSYTEDYANFLTGVRDSDSIQVTPNTSEPCTWLLSRGDSLYQGTRGSVVTYSSTDGKSITPLNVKANEALEFGGSTIQGIKTNETVVYLERLNKKLREIFYNDDEKGLVSRDLTIMSSEIADGGFTELVLQRTPDQIIYGLRSDGKLAGLTYERSQDVFGWAVFDLGGKVTSIAIRPSGTHDELWVTIERDNGTFIERLGSREFSDDLLDAWYVDSGVKEVLLPKQTADRFDVGTYPDWKITITKDNHGLINDDKIRLSNVTGLPELNDDIFTVADATTNTFALKSEDNSVYISYAGYIPPTKLTLTGTGDEWSDIYTSDGSRAATWYSSELNGYDAEIRSEVDDWVIVDGLTNDVFFYQEDDSGPYPPVDTWFNKGNDQDAGITITYNYDIVDITGDFTQVAKEWSGLTHLNGKTVQIQGDGGFAGTAVVDSGIITTDTYYNQAVIGLRYFSILRPMYIEASGFSSQNYNKNVKSAEIGFYRTINGYSGNMLQKDDRTPEFDFDELEADWPNLDKSRYSMEPIKFRRYGDAIGAPIIPLTGTKKVNYRDTLSKIKSMFVIADIPMPMCVTSLSINLSIGGN